MVKLKKSKFRINFLLLPSVTLLIIWMLIPLSMTLWFSFQNYNLINPFLDGFAGFDNFKYLLTDEVFWFSILKTLILVISVLLISIFFGVLFAVIFDQDFFGKNIARLLIIAPFFIMPTVASLVWKNLLMHPVNGFLAFIFKSFNFIPIDWFSQFPLFSVIVIISWQWIPFASLILITAMQSLDREQLEAAKLDGAKGLKMFYYIILPHLLRPISIVIMMETIFLLAVFAEILITASGGPGTSTTILTYFIYIKAFLEWDIGGASAAGVTAIILANILAFFFIKTVAKNLDN